MVEITYSFTKLLRVRSMGAAWLASWDSGSLMRLYARSWPGWRSSEGMTGREDLLPGSLTWLPAGGARYLTTWASPYGCSQLGSLLSPKARDHREKEDETLATVLMII